MTLHDAHTLTREGIPCTDPKMSPFGRVSRRRATKPTFMRCFKILSQVIGFCSNAVRATTNLRGARQHDG